MKTFHDLVFQPKSYGGIHATLDFPNGYGVSVISGEGAYADGPNEFELAVTKGGHLCYTTDITDDVLGHLSRDEVTSIMEKVQNLESSHE